MFAWIVGVICAGIVGTLAVLAIPLLSSSLSWLSNPGAAATGAPADEGDGPSGCRGLYTEPLWASLQYEPGSQLTSTTDAPVTTATALVEALAPAVRFTCTWTADIGSISTTVGEVGTDAGSIAASALPAQGFSCTESAGRTMCSRTDGELVETIESGGGVWVSTSQTAWHPPRYAGRVGDAVFAG